MRISRGSDKISGKDNRLQATFLHTILRSFGFDGIALLLLISLYGTFLALFLFFDWSSRLFWSALGADNAARIDKISWLLKSDSLFDELLLFFLNPGLLFSRFFYYEKLFYDLFSSRLFLHTCQRNSLSLVRGGSYKTLNFMHSQNNSTSFFLQFIKLYRSRYVYIVIRRNILGERAPLPTLVDLPTRERHLRRPERVFLSETRRCSRKLQWLISLCDMLDCLHQDRQSRRFFFVRARVFRRLVIIDHFTKIEVFEGLTHTRTVTILSVIWRG